MRPRLRAQRKVARVSQRAFKRQEQERPQRGACVGNEACESIHGIRHGAHLRAHRSADGRPLPKSIWKRRKRRSTSSCRARPLSLWCHLGRHHKTVAPMITKMVRLETRVNGSNLGLGMGLMELMESVIHCSRESSPWRIIIGSEKEGGEVIQEGEAPTLALLSQWSRALSKT